ncbi:AraC family transcriptional regulator [Marinitenerispora sediminis]|uniref:AraC family transcriptional regulator n=1 Tax=Marinitenerispora sediminis TaxID=1931232 RepID=A0A368T0L6_9ACTN|nr:AraC family transcriptional regulator [Marinitenerispora sediminis]RCV50138.1 AraC family transcriptional regulator [Marinitenerispora sediminis]RCV53044.1 AraC family transcriptional regulator [Marinitenerispora sediminis]
MAVLAVPRAFALDCSISAYVLGGHPGYRVLMCGDRYSAPTGGASGQPSPAEPIMEVTPAHPLSEVERADVVVVPGYEDPHLPIPESHLTALRRAARRGARMVAVCTGTFALASSGILDGRTATTHWKYAGLLRRLHPEVDVVENRLFVEDGPVLTSAGATASVDAFLHVVRTDFGAEAADRAAKDTVSLPTGDPDEPRYADALTPTRASLRATREWVMANIGSAITVQRMADRSMLSRRTFIRRFERETGMPPMQWVVHQRIRRARSLLETSDWSVERIAGATGFGTAANFRAIFRREVGETPSAYRRSHGAERAGGRPVGCS